MSLPRRLQNFAAGLEIRDEKNHILCIGARNVFVSGFARRQNPVQYDAHRSPVRASLVSFSEQVVGEVWLATACEISITTTRGPLHKKQGGCVTIGVRMSALVLKSGSVLSVCQTPTSEAEFVAVLLEQLNKLRAVKGVRQRHSYVSSLKMIALGRLAGAIAGYRPEDCAAIVRAASAIEGAQQWLPEMPIAHLSTALREVADGRCAPAVAAELVAACAAAELDDTFREHLSLVGYKGLEEIAGSVEVLADAVTAASKRAAA